MTTYRGTGPFRMVSNQQRIAPNQHSRTTDSTSMVHPCVNETLGAHTAPFPKQKPDGSLSECLLYRSTSCTQPGSVHIYMRTKHLHINLHLFVCDISLRICTYMYMYVCIISLSHSLSLSLSLYMCSCVCLCVCDCMYVHARVFKRVTTYSTALLFTPTLVMYMCVTESNVLTNSNHLYCV